MLSLSHITHVQLWSELLAPLVNMIKESSENKPSLLIILILFKKQIYPLNKLKQLKIGENLIMKIFFFSNARWTQLLVPLEILMSKISLVYSHSYLQFWALWCDYEHESIQPWLPVSQKYK